RQLARAVGRLRRVLRLHGGRAPHRRVLLREAGRLIPESQRPAAPRPIPDVAPPSRVLARLKRWVRPIPAASADGPFTELDARRLGAVRRYFVRPAVVVGGVVALSYATAATV